MAKKSVSKRKRKPGRPAGRVQDTPLHLRVSDKFAKAIDDWRNKQPDRPSRSEAIRRLIEQAIERLRT